MYIFQVQEENWGKTDGEREKNNKSLLAFPSNSINHKNTFSSVAETGLREKKICGRKENEKNYLNDIRTWFSVCVFNVVGDFSQRPKGFFMSY